MVFALRTTWIKQPGFSN